MQNLLDDLENEKEEGEAEKDVFSVSDFLDLINTELEEFEARIVGEVTSISKRSNYLRFKIKDSEDESILKCFMWRSDYKISDVEIEEGMEIIVQGYPEVYKPYGDLSLQTQTVELVGEGALMKAYKKLKKKLKKEGVFSEERKRDLPQFPKKIGVITSLRGGTVIHDFENNLGKFGFSIKAIDARVEGKKATKSLLSALDRAEDLDIDVLVIIRGGGSIEALQAFDNEVLVRKVVDFDVPVIAGIGHHEDKTLVALAADRAESTPQGVAEMLNEPWKEARNALALHKKSLFSKMENVLGETRREFDNLSSLLSNNFKQIVDTFKNVQSKWESVMGEFSHRIQKVKKEIETSFQFISRDMDSAIENVHSELQEAKKVFDMNDPRRNLDLGYSIVSKDGDVIKSVDDVSVGDGLEIKVSDGNIDSEVKEKNSN
ncbi:MAG: exodeoxyribonuclease VII large subunit [Candidatus Magasanikbacteria bacterium]